ncbi:MAG: hypothetical protein Kow0068_03000 [Marinilabiliales bacterium]
MLINGVNVSVTSLGIVDTYTTYCTNTFPYFIGYHWPSTAGNGSYSFTFSPPVSALTLNFSGISDYFGNQEIVKLYINGQHYSIPSIGTTNNCDPMAILTTSGDITGCSGCQVSGWVGTTVSGTISSLTVFDTLVFGSNAGGALFSLFICNPSTDIISLPDESETNIFPNPFNNEITITTNSSILSQIILYDMMAKKYIQQTFTNSVTLNTERLATGIYFYEVINEKGVIRKGKVIKQ